VGLFMNLDTEDALPLNPLDANTLGLEGLQALQAQGALVGSLLLQQGISLALAESCTGGLLSSLLTDVPGSSAYTGLNVVTYSNEAKMQLLGVDSALLEQHGAVSEAVAVAMAKGLLGLTQTLHPQASEALTGVWAFSVTGIAGPGGGSVHKPVGLVYFALAQASYGTGNGLQNKAPLLPYRVCKVQCQGVYPRTVMKQSFAEKALTLLQLALTKQPWPPFF
jgi:PncC family amidohydrolase